MLNVSKGEYFNLNEIGSTIWNYLESPRTFQDIITMLVDKYEVSYTVCKSETEEFLLNLRKEKLVSFKNEKYSE